MCSVPSLPSCQIGWHSIKPGPKHHMAHSNYTDVTKGEGLTAKSYYGHFLCPN